MPALLLLLVASCLPLAGAWCNSGDVGSACYLRVHSPAANEFARGMLFMNSQGERAGAMHVVPAKTADGQAHFEVFIGGETEQHRQLSITGEGAVAFGEDNVRLEPNGSQVVYHHGPAGPAAHPGLAFLRRRGKRGAPLPVAPGDGLGAVSFKAFDGQADLSAASLRAEAEAEVPAGAAGGGSGGSGGVGSRLVLATTPSTARTGSTAAGTAASLQEKQDGGNPTVDRMTIDAAGRVAILTAETDALTVAGGIRVSAEASLGGNLSCTGNCSHIAFEGVGSKGIIVPDAEAAAFEVIVAGHAAANGAAGATATSSGDTTMLRVDTSATDGGPEVRLGAVLSHSHAIGVDLSRGARPVTAGITVIDVADLSHRALLPPPAVTAGRAYTVCNTHATPALVGVDQIAAEAHATEARAKATKAGVVVAPADAQGEAGWFFRGGTVPLLAIDVPQATCTELVSDGRHYHATGQHANEQLSSIASLKNEEGHFIRMMGNDTYASRSPEQTRQDIGVRTAPVVDDQDTKGGAAGGNSGSRPYRDVAGLVTLPLPGPGMACVNDDPEAKAMRGGDVEIHAGLGGGGPGGVDGTVKIFGNLEVTGDVTIVADGSYKIHPDGAAAITYADYVFEPDYPLMPLDDLQRFVRSNRHLPNVTAASDLGKTGLDLVADGHVRLLEKVEEATLYALQLHRRTTELEAAVAAERSKNAALESKVNALMDERARDRERRKAESDAVEARLAAMEAALTSGDSL
eukprot:g6603.t1